MNFPLPSLLAVSAENPWSYLVFLLIGFAFGFTLEMSGFGNSQKLAAQFYFKDLTVLKVMFTAIIVAMTLTFGAVGLGLLDFSQVWVNPTYVPSGVFGGLIMGVGFIIGGFCPTTSLASASTGKIDGMFFVLGGFVGAFLFGETERFFTDWYNNAGYFGRLTLMDVFNLPAGVIVVGVVLMALFMFWGAEQLERLIGKKDMTREPKLRLYGAGAIVALALGVAFIGIPSLEQKYTKLNFPETIPTDTEGQQSIVINRSADQMLSERLVQASPAEVYKTMFDNSLVTTLIDVRSESDYNRFHINKAYNVPLATVSTLVPQLQAKHTPNTVYILMSNDETDATAAWKILVANGIANVYILEGGVNNWIAFFGKDDPEIKPMFGANAREQLRYTFPAYLGARYHASYPNPQKYEELEFEPKIKLQIKRDKSGGGCG